MKRSEAIEVMTDCLSVILMAGMDPETGSKDVLAMEERYNEILPDRSIYDAARGTSEVAIEALSNAGLIFDPE